MSNVRIIDNFATANDLAALARGWPAKDWPGWVHYGIDNGWKLASDARMALPFAASVLLYQILDVAPTTDARPDLGLWGAGLHETPNGDGLGLHTDAGQHALLGLARTHTSILYVHRKWQPGWGGELLLPGLKIEPLPGRLVVFDCRAVPHAVAPVIFGEGYVRRSLTLFWYGGMADQELPRRATFAR